MRDKRASFAWRALLKFCACHTADIGGTWQQVMTELLWQPWPAAASAPAETNSTNMIKILKESFFFFKK